MIAALAGDILGAGAFYEAQQRHTEAVGLFTAFGLWKAAADTLKLAQSSNGRGNQHAVKQAREALAEAWKEQGAWQLAIESYQKLRPREGLLEALFLSDSYDELERLASDLSEGDVRLLLRAAELLAAAGRGQAAAAAFLKAKKPEDAVDAALQGGEWGSAICLARQHCNGRKVQGVLAAYKAALQHQHRRDSDPDALEGLLGLGVPEAAAQQLSSLTEQLGPFTRDPQKQRKIHVKAALLAHQGRLKDGPTTQEALGLVCCPRAASSSSSGQRALSPGDGGGCCHALNIDEERHWNSAAACHLYLLYCFHLSERRARAALCLAVRLRDCYPREVPLQVRARLLLVSACKAREWDLCSQALHALEMSCQASASERKHLETTSVSLFANRQDPAPTRASRELPCPRCNELSCCWECYCPACDAPFAWCAATGLPIRYIEHLLQHTTPGGKDKGASAAAPSALVASPRGNGEGVPPEDPDNTWPYGGPPVPEACRTCGLFTAAWGPGGPLRSCPFCSQPFSPTATTLVQRQTVPAEGPGDDGAASYISRLNPDEILLQSGGISDLRQA